MDLISFLQQQKMKGDLLLTRDDGNLIYSSKGDDHHLAALASALFKAASSMLPLSENFSLSYATSNSGIFIVPLLGKDFLYYLVSIYQDEDNPALLRQRVKQLATTLLDKLQEERYTTINLNDITDEEMSDLFFF